MNGHFGWLWFVSLQTSSMRVLMFNGSHRLGAMDNNIK
jgi:hypothetical protein